MNQKNIKELAELYADNSILTELAELYGSLDSIKKQKNIMISVFAVISFTAVWLLFVYQETAFWFLFGLLLLHDAVFIKVSGDIIKEEREIIFRISSIQTKLLQSR